MANIANEINNIRSAVYGEEVRSSIVDGIEAINEEAENTTFRQKKVEEKQDNLNTSQEALNKRWDVQIKNITDANPSNVEIVDGRVSTVKGLTYANLGLRLNDIEEDLLSRKINVMYPPGGLTGLKRIISTDIQETELQAIATANTTALNTLIAYAATGPTAATNTTLYFPQGIFPLLNGIRIKNSISFEGEMGKITSIRYIQAYTGGTYLYDVSDTESRVPFLEWRKEDTITADANTGRLPGVFMLGINVHGRSQKHDGVRLIKTGMVGRIENTTIREFLGHGLYTNMAYDTNVWGLDITTCGSVDKIEQLNEDGTIKKDSNGNTLYEQRYALCMDGTGTSGDTNAWNIFGLHMEICAFMMDLRNCRHIKFTGCKWEQNTGELGNATYPLFNLDKKAKEITFVGSVISPVDVAGYKAKFGDDFVPAHAIYVAKQDITQTIRFSQCAKFVACDFTNVNECMMLKSDASVIVDACKFDHIYSGNNADGSKNYGIYLNGPNNILSNSNISFKTYKGVNNGIYLNGGNADANTFLTSRSVYDLNNNIAEVYDYAITATNGARVGVSNYYDVSCPVRILSNDCTVTRSGRSSKITDDKLVKMGVTDLTKVNIDMNLLGSLSETLVFSLSEDTSIQRVSNCCAGDEITIINANSTNLKILNNTSIADCIRLSNYYDKNGKLKTSVTLNAYDCIKIKNMGTYWVEVARNIQSENSSSRDDDIKEELILSLNCLQSDVLTTAKVNLFKEDSSKKNLKLKSCYSSSNYRFIAPYNGFFKVQIHTYCNPSISSPSYFHSISHLIHYKTVDNAPSIIQDVALTRVSTFGGMAGYAIATRVVYMEKGEFFELFADGHNENTYSATYQQTQINVSGIKEIS